MPMQQLGHSNNAELFERSTDPSGIKVICSGAKGDAWMVWVRPASIQQASAARTLVRFPPP